MIVISLSSCPPALKGDLTAWLQEIDAGVFVGHLNARVRDELWLRICKHIKNGRALMVYQSDNEQRMDFRVHNTKWQPMDFDGLKLMLRPDPGYCPQKSTAPARGFSKASAYHQSKVWAKRAGRRPFFPEGSQPAPLSNPRQPIEKEENLPIAKTPTPQAIKHIYNAPDSFSQQMQSKTALSATAQKVLPVNKPHEDDRKDITDTPPSAIALGAMPTQTVHEPCFQPQLPRSNLGLPPYIVLDIETTGLSLGKDQMFEVAAILVVDGQVQDHYQSLIRIPSPLPPHIQALCGISQEQLDQDGRKLSSVLSEFLAFVGNHPVVSHNAAFDYGFLRAACTECGLPPFSNPYTDTLPLARRRIKDIANYQLSTLAEYLDIQIERHHRALNDCLATHFVYEHLLSLSR